MHSLPYAYGSNLKNLKAEGLSAGMPLIHNRALRRYRVLFLILQPAKRWQMKSLAMDYLYKEFEAYDFEFFASRQAPDTGFYCEFTSFAVEGI